VNGHFIAGGIGAWSKAPIKRPHVDMTILFTHVLDSSASTASSIAI